MSIVQKLEEMINAGWGTKPESSQFASWIKRVTQFLRAAGFVAESEKVQSFYDDISVSANAKASILGFLEGMVAVQQEMNKPRRDEDLTAKGTLGPPQSVNPKRVFVVHGHDAEAKETVARFLEGIGLEPIILHERPNTGLTVVEKFEAFSNVGFAVVLLTPDDIGGSKSQKDNLRPRARQNVILELGYFLGKLARKRVCALYKSDIEIPSDYQGVLYIEIDAAGGWRTKLAQELVEAGFSIKLESLLKS